MSTKSTILLSNDNEHWYHDCSDDSIVLEFDKKNFTVLIDDADDFVIEVPNGRDLWEEIMKLNHWCKRSGD